MTKTTKFQPGKSGIRKRNSRLGNPYRWQPGQSGNPPGIACSRVQFEEAFYAASPATRYRESGGLRCYGTSPARGEPWAILTLLQRLAPESHDVNRRPGGAWIFIDRR